MNKDIFKIASEAGFKALFEYATVGIIVVNRAGEIVISNPPIEKLFDYTSAELTGQKIELLIPERFHSKHKENIASYHKSPSARPMMLGIDVFARKKCGEEFPVEISLGKYEVEGEQLAVAFISDISKRKNAELEKIQYTLELEKQVQQRTQMINESLQSEKELNEMKSHFVSIASHEFRTPLSTILSSVSLLEKYIKKNDPEKTEKHLGRIKNSVYDLTQLINDFLSIEKLEKGNKEAVKKDFELPKLVNFVSSELDNNLKQGQEIIYTHTGDEVIFSNKDFLYHVLTNLVSNAIKYSSEDKPVFISTSVSRTEIRIEVKDNGIGIPEKDHEKMFGLFFRAGNVGNIQGTGLGLNIVSRYVNLLNGTISFQSEEGMGTTFILLFPAE